MKSSRLKDMFAIFINELGLVFFTGFIPMFIVKWTQPAFDPSLYLRDLSPSDPLVYYSFSLFVLQLFLSFFCHNYPSKSIEKRDKLDKFFHFFAQLSSGIQGIYRALAGGLLAGISIIMHEIGFAKGWYIVSGFTIGFAFIIILMCVFMERTNQLALPTRLKPTRY
ncbi:hypothetical protein OTK51_18105 [Vibrio scophthalmi]|uniref:hypothetical protein n=1 Tax=Vibrio scophthalmi TaxID=45658 RepID=UPI002284EBEA|nr:hypothetical protein [Vibrio scophthalmi]MCY9805340.1 hypothetical protein [Vibrio scophthalmi]